MNELHLSQLRHLRCSVYLSDNQPRIFSHTFLQTKEIWLISKREKKYHCKIRNLNGVISGLWLVLSEQKRWIFKSEVLTVAVLY